MQEYTAKMQSNTQIFYDKDSREAARWIYGDKGTIKKTGKRINGVVRMYHEGGVLASEITYKNSELNGHYLLLSPEGKIEEEGFFRDNNLDGEYKQYHENGRLKLAGGYKKGRREGAHKLYYPSGSIQEEEFYKDGVLDGEEREYYESGVLAVYAAYKKGKLKMIRQYAEDGTLKKEENY
ncbi:MAG TPA: toxin-antitoxin system YwqK family antitoxin [bacterium]|nr:toxin-antitoxin system YwqK family antitoxin [bacterium]